MTAPAKVATITLPVLIAASYAHEILSLVPAYVRLHSRKPFYVAESIDKVGGAVACLIALSLIYGTGLRGAMRRLGLSVPLLPAVAFALIASSPMLVGFALTRSVTPQMHVIPLLFLVVLQPEKIGFGANTAFQ